MKLSSEEEQKNWNSSALHPLQSWEWGEFRKSTGVDIIRYHGSQITFHALPHLPFTIGYFPKGDTITNTLIQEILHLGKQKKAIFIQIEPNIIINSQTIPNNKNMIPSHHPLFTKYTFVLDLTKTEDELLSVMHNKTRYNIKVALKHKVVIQEDNSDEAFEEYIRLSEETTNRQGFYAHTRSYHEKMWKTLFPAGIAKLFTAVYQNKTLAAWIIFCWKDTIYYPYGASSRDNREVMAPTLLLWEIAKWGKSKGYNKFDLWGAMGLDPDIHDPWYGFHRFKEGFHPKLVEFIGSYDVIVQPLLYPLYCIADDIRWKILRKK